MDNNKKVLLATICLITYSLSLEGSSFFSTYFSSLSPKKEKSPEEIKAATDQLQNACDRGDLTMSELALKEGARVENVNLLPLCYEGNTIAPLIISERKKKGLSVDAEQNTLGATSLYFASLKKFEPIAKALLEAHADALKPLTAGDLYHTIGDTPFHAACKSGCSAELIKLFLEKNGTKILEARNAHGQTPFHYFCNGTLQQLDVLELLLQKGALSNIPDNGGNIPFHFACKSKPTDKELHKAALALLMQHGANPFFENNLQIAPEDYASEAGFALDSNHQTVVDLRSSEGKAIEAERIKRGDDLACVICLGTKKEQKEKLFPCVTFHDCKHKFHRACGNRWTTTHPTCPICRDDLTKK